MSQTSRRWGLVGACLVALLVAAEVGANFLLGGRATVEVINESVEPIEDLTATLGADRVVVGRVAPGATTLIRLADRGEGPRTLVLKFRQRGNALGVFELPGFNPADLRRDGMKQVLHIRPNEVERHMDDDDAPPTTPAGRLARHARQSIQDSLDELTAPR